MTVKPDAFTTGQESVWDFPRPPRAELTECPSKSFIKG
jgi:hypothetical protein